MAESIQERMTAAEFLELPESNTSPELIHGRLVVSPTPKNPHQQIVGKLFIWLNEATGKLNPSGEAVISPMDVHLDDENVVQPDVFWVSGQESRCQLGEDGYWHGAPDLVIEVLSPSTTRRDKIDKFRLYERHAAQEYWLVDPQAQVVEVFGLEEERFQHRGVFGPEETFTSAVLKGEKVKLTKVFNP